MSLARQCGKKIKFPDKQSANYAAYRLRTSAAPDDKFDIYQCPYCKAWHFGHARPASKKKRKTKRPRKGTIEWLSS